MQLHRRRDNARPTSVHPSLPVRASARRRARSFSEHEEKKRSSSACKITGAGLRWRRNPDRRRPVNPCARPWREGERGSPRHRLEGARASASQREADRPFLGKPQDVVKCPQRLHKRYHNHEEERSHHEEESSNHGEERWHHEEVRSHRGEVRSHHGEASSHRGGEKPSHRRSRSKHGALRWPESPASTAPKPPPLAKPALPLNPPYDQATLPHNRPRHVCLATRSAIFPAPRRNYT